MSSISPKLNSLSILKVLVVLTFEPFGCVCAAPSDPKGVSVHQVHVLWRCQDHEPLDNRNTYCEGKYNLALCNIFLKDMNVLCLKRTHLLRCLVHLQYGVSLYENYKTAERKAAINSVWTKCSAPSSSNPSAPSPTMKGSRTPQSSPVSLMSITVLCVHTWCFLLLFQANQQVRPMVTQPNPHQDLFLRYSQSIIIICLSLLRKMWVHM